MGSIQNRKKIAIIGSGCAGLGAAWALTTSNYEVHIFEKSSRLGGHTNTQPFKAPNGETIPVDTGFIVMNTATYPNFIRFLQEVGVDPIQTEMTFSVSRDQGKFEWSGEPQGTFAQRRNLFRLRHWRLIFDIVRFNQFALDLLVDDDESGIKRLGSTREWRKYAADMSIGEYLDREGYSQSFRDDYLIPMTAAVWSTSPDKASLEFPAKTLVRFLWNHHLLSTIAARPPWLTIPGGSQRYINAIVEGFPKDRLHVHLESEVANVVRPDPGEKGDVALSWIKNSTGEAESAIFAHVIFACHGDEVLPILTKHELPSHRREAQANTSKSRRPNATHRPRSHLSAGIQYVSQDEHAIFSAFQTSENTCYLHSDLSLMPTRRACWTAWNYLTRSQTSQPRSSSSPGDAGVSLTYCMNILQHYPEAQYGPVLVTMNPHDPPAPERTQGKYIYRHPLYTAQAVRAQKHLEALQGRRGVSYCGAWTKYGFHEDGFSSGLKVAVEQLGAKLPFEFVDSTYSRGHRPELMWKDYVVRLVVLMVLMVIRGVEMVLRWPLIGMVVVWLEILATKGIDVAEGVGLIRDST